MAEKPIAEKPAEKPTLLPSDNDPRSAALWKSLRASAATFLHAPCLSTSLATGATGGGVIFALRYAGTRGMATAVTWGVVAAWGLTGSNWFVCRRAFYARLAEEDARKQERRQAEGREWAAKAPLKAAPPRSTPLALDDGDAHCGSPSHATRP